MADQETIAAAIANARGGRRGMPPIKNILDVLPDKLRNEVMDDAAAVMAAIRRPGAGSDSRRLAFAADAELLLRRLLEAETFTPFTEKEWSIRIADAMEEARTLLGHLDAPATGAVLPGEMG